MTTTLHVLSIGSMESRDAVRDVLLLRRRCRLSAAESYRDLCSVPASECFDIAILHPLRSGHELRISLEHVRRNWPHTRILLVCANAEGFDDPLYDERVSPDMSQDAFLSVIEQLVMDAKREMRQSISGQSRSGEQRKLGVHD
jgi:hypothetical protein